jgi:hypothetical protein
MQNLRTLKQSFILLALTDSNLNKFYFFITEPNNAEVKKVCNQLFKE